MRMDDSIAVASWVAYTGIGGLIALAVALVAVSVHTVRLRRAIRIHRSAAYLAESEARCLVAILDSLPIPIWWHRADLQLEFANAKLRDLDAADGDAIANLADPELARQAAFTGIEQTVSRHHVVDGERRLYVVAAQPAAGGIAGHALDMTTLEDIQAQLARHLAATNEVLESLRTAIAIFGADRRLKFANAAYAKLWRLDQAFLRAEPNLSELLDTLREERRLPEQADFPAYKREVARLFTLLIDAREELIHLPDETTFRMIVTPHPMGGLIFTYEDVTDTLVLERGRAEAIEVRDLVFDRLREGIALFGPDRRLAHANPAFRRAWGLGAGRDGAGGRFGEILNRLAERVAPGADWPTLRAAMEREAERGGVPLGDGTRLLWRRSPLPDGALLLCVDIAGPLAGEGEGE